MKTKRTSKEAKRTDPRERLTDDLAVGHRKAAGSKRSALRAVKDLAPTRALRVTGGVNDDATQDLRPIVTKVQTNSR